MKLKKIKLRNDASILTQSELKLIRGGETFYYCRCKENEDHLILQVVRIA